MKISSKKFALGLAMGLWVVGVSVVMTYLASTHSVSFFPDRSLASVNDGQWTMTHVLGKGCKCSEQVYQYLLQRGPQKNIIEQVIFLGDMNKEAAALQTRGFQVHSKPPRQIASEKAIGVPFLLVTSPKGDALYSGGYSNHTIREGTALHDLEILAALKDGKTSSEFPIFGCAVSQRIQKLIDPLSLKYKESPL